MKSKKYEGVENETAEPHLVVYHFAIINNFYGAIFNSQDSTFQFGHQVTIDFLKTLPKKPISDNQISALKEAATAEHKSQVEAFSPKIKGCDSRCSIPLGESLRANSCLSCKGGVLNSSDHKCLQFCPSNLKNSGGICIACLDGECSEKPPMKLFIDRREEGKFRIKMNQKIMNMPREKMPEFFKVELLGVKPEFYTTKISPISDTEAEVELRIHETLYNKNMRVSLDEKVLREQQLYDQNFNEVKGLEESIHIGTMTYLKDGDKRLVDFLSTVVIILFFATLGFLLFFFLLNCRSDKFMTHYIYKKMVRFACKVQFTAFLIFLNCQMSPQLRRFLKTIYQYCVGFTQIFRTIHRDPYVRDLWTRPVPVFERHINFEEHEVFRYFLQNFGLVVVLHGLIFLAFVALALFKCCSARSTKSLPSCLARLKNIFSLNVLVLFFLFQLPIYVFVCLNLKYLSFGQHAFFTASSVLTLVYLLATVIFLGLIVRVFSRRDQLLDNSHEFSPQKFYSVSYYLLGFKRRIKTFYFELVFIGFNLAHAVLLVFFYKWPSIHVLSDAALVFAFLICILAVRPFESFTEFLIEVTWLSVLLVVYVALAFMAYLDLDNRNALFERNIIGWIAVAILFTALVCYFAHLCYQIVRFCCDMRKNSKVLLTRFRPSRRRPRPPSPARETPVPPPRSTRMTKATTSAAVTSRHPASSPTRGPTFR